MIRNGRYTGRVNTGAEFETILTGVGFKDVDHWWLLQHQLGVVTARKSS